MPFDPVSYAMGQKSAGGGSGGSSTLSGLTDVDISNPTDGQTLVYDAASSKWVNGSGGGGSTNQIFVFTPADTDKVTIGGTDYSLFYSDPDPLRFFLASPDVINSALLTVQLTDIETLIAYNMGSLFKGMTATVATPASVPGNAIYADPPVACLYIEDMEGNSYVVVPNNVTYLPGSPK